MLINGVCFIYQGDTQVYTSYWSLICKWINWSTYVRKFKSCWKFKGATIATRAASKWGGVTIKLSGLSPCLLYSVFYFNSVVCRLLSVSY